MDVQLTPIQKRFYLGSYRELAQLYESGELDDALACDQSQYAFVMGALSFLGQLEKTKTLLAKLQQGQASRSTLSQCQFYYVLLLARLSHYQAAREQIIQLLAHRNSELAHCRFYAYQALAFYRFYQGRYQDAKDNALTSLKASRGAYEALLAKDLLGHSYSQLGQSVLGDNYFRQALALAKSLDFSGFEKLVTHSLIGHQVERGERLSECAQYIEEELKQTAIESFYSRSELFLKLAKIYRLRGERDRALGAINEASLTIYKHQNRRHMAILYLNMASLELTTGAQGRALQLIDVGLTQLEPKMDYDHQLKLKGLKYKLLKTLPFEDKEESAALLAEINQLTSLVGTGVARQILARDQLAQGLNVRNGLSDDHLGEILSKFKKEDSLLKLNIKDWETLHRDHLFGLIDYSAEAQKCLGKTLLIISKIPKSLIVGKGGNFQLSAKGVSALSLKLCRMLYTHQSLSKEDITRELYGHEYNPITHDSLIHSLVARARRALGEFQGIIQNDDGFYKWDQSCVLIDCTVSEEVVEISARVVPKASQDLNIRQYKLLEQARKGELTSITPGDYRELFEVSRITASRDLGELCERGHFYTLGKARSITYIYDNH